MAPVIGGNTTNHDSSITTFNKPIMPGSIAFFYSWRVMQALIGVFGIVKLLFIYFLFPETSHPGARGVDKLMLENRPVKFIFINPLRPLALLRSPNLLLIVRLVLTN